MIKIKNQQKILAIILVVIMVLTVFITPITASAAERSDVDVTTSSVREDLASMGEDKLTYLSNTNNIFITVSQYYDSENKLRTYLYVNYIGSIEDILSISISTSVTDDKNDIIESFADYPLRFVNNDSTWVKYEILNLPNVEFVTRRYNLGSISSASGKILDINETYIFHGITNGTIEVFNQQIEIITITEKEVHFFCYGEESKWYDFWGLDEFLGHDKKYTDAWYIFFNTDKTMDNIKEIEITYMPYDYHIQFMGGCKMNYAITDEVLQNRIDGTDFDEETTRKYGEQEIVTIMPGTTKVSATTNWWGGYETKYQELDNIMDLRSYKASDDEGNPFVFTEQAGKYTWGVNFLNTEKTSKLKGVSLMGNSVDTCVVDGTGVCNTAILRIKYETNGIVKNAYASDVPTDDFEGSTAQVDIAAIGDIFEKLISVILLLLLIVVVVNVIAPIVNPMFKLLVNIVGVIAKAIVKVVIFPFNVLIRKRK